MRTSGRRRIERIEIYLGASEMDLSAIEIDLGPTLETLPLQLVRAENPRTLSPIFGFLSS